MMNALLAQEASLALGTSTALVLIALVIFLAFFFWAWSSIERGQRPNLRSLQPLNRLRRIIGQSAETGQSVHYSPGTGGLNGQIGTAETLNGLTSLSSVARVAARTKADLIVTADDTLAYLAADDVVKAQYAQAGRSEDYDPAQVRFVTQQDRLAYMAGVTGLISEQKLAGNLMLGRLESEYLLAGDRANRRDLPQVVGSSRIEAMPLMLASAGPDNALLGEELFAAPAYLDREPAHVAGVVAQDRIRLVIIVLIIAGTVAATLGLNIGTLLLR
jgi:hypothetical protein